MQLKIYQVDAFTDRLFGGNPAAVIPLKQTLPDDLLQAIAAENNLSETAYVTRKGKGYDLRWFTPTVEVDLCGHATLATSHVLWKHLGVTSETLEFNTRSGKLSVQQAGDFYRMDFPTDKLEQATTPIALIEAFNIAPKAVFVGREDYLVIVENQEVVENLNPDFKKLMEVKGRGVIVTAPGRDVDFVSRCFFPNFGIDEDPVTRLGTYDADPVLGGTPEKDGTDRPADFRRGGFLKCHLQGERTLLFGQAVTFLTGKIVIGNH